MYFNLGLLPSPYQLFRKIMWRPEGLLPPEGANVIWKSTKNPVPRDLPLFDLTWTFMEKLYSQGIVDYSRNQ